MSRVATLRNMIKNWKDDEIIAFSVWTMEDVEDAIADAGVKDPTVLSKDDKEQILTDFEDRGTHDWDTLIDVIKQTIEEKR